MGLCLSFIAFEIKVLKHLTMTTSQLHSASWAYIKVYQYLCKYMKVKPYVVIFFHLFKYRSGLTNRMRSRELISLEPNVRGFRPLLELQNCEDQFFLVTPINPEAHVTVCIVGDRVGGRCVKLFPKYWTEIFLLGEEYI